jgi:putative RNA 2'-phosphotransferase
MGGVDDGQETEVTNDPLKEIVCTDSKGRYTMTETHIRANQGHSVKGVSLTFEKKVPPPVLYHGTPNRNVLTIAKEGIKKMNRHHVHLSADKKTAEAVGGRRGSFCVLTISTREMVKDGVEFFLSDNGVWLTDYVDPKYIVVLK